MLFDDNIEDRLTISHISRCDEKRMVKTFPIKRNNISSTKVVDLNDSEVYCFSKSLSQQHGIKLFMSLNY